MRTFGYLDIVYEAKLVGWAAAETDGGERLRCDVVLFIDGVSHSRCYASGYRQDLLEHGIVPGSFGFEIQMPNELADSTSAKVEVRTSDGTKLIGPEIRIARGKFYTGIALADDELFRDLCRECMWSEIEEKARIVQRSIGHEAMIYYVYGLLLSRSPTVFELEKDLQKRGKLREMIASIAQLS